MLNGTFNICINDNIYRVKLVEDMHGPKRIVIPMETKIHEPDGDDNNFSSNEGGGMWDQEICLRKKIEAP